MVYLFGRMKIPTDLFSFNSIGIERLFEKTTLIITDHYAAKRILMAESCFCQIR